jgi:hypothetical protein
VPRQKTRIAGHLMRRFVADDLDIGVLAFDLDEHLNRVGQADDLGGIGAALAAGVFFAGLQRLVELGEHLELGIRAVIVKNRRVVAAAPKAAGAGKARAEPLGKQDVVLVVVEQHDLQPLLGNFQLDAIGKKSQQERFIDRFQQL